jgi:hypothetical protein
MPMLGVHKRITMFNFSKGFVAIFFFIISFGAQHANANIIYNIDLDIDLGNNLNAIINGTIETDGIIGVLGSSNITGLDFVLTSPNSLDVQYSFLDTIVNITGNPFTATSNALYFLFDENNMSYLQFETANPNPDACCNTIFALANGTYSNDAPFDAGFRINNGVGFFNPAFNGNFQIATVTVPEPGYLAIFALTILLSRRLIRK